MKYDGKYVIKRGKRKGQYKGFVKKTYNALNKINSGYYGRMFISMSEKYGFYYRIKKRTFGHSSYEEGVVYFNPNNTVAGYDTEGSMYTEPYVILAHELAHNFQYSIVVKTPLWYITEDGEKVYTSDIYATHIENLIRLEHGLPLREFYSTIGDRGEEAGRLIINVNGSYVSKYISSYRYDRENNRFYYVGPFVYK